MKEKTKTIRVSEKMHRAIKCRASKRGMKIEDFIDLLLVFALREGAK